MASKRRCAQESSCASRRRSKPTCPVVKRIAKGSLPRKVGERRRSPSLCTKAPAFVEKDGKVMYNTSLLKERALNESVRVFECQK